MPTALSTDLYEITMAAGYAGGGEAVASFELSVRRLPPTRGYLVAAGLEPALDYLEGLRFTADEVAYLRGLSNLSGVPASFFDDVLPALRFRGDVWAVAEGEVVFAHEPLLRVTASTVEAQIVETALLATMLFQTAVASRASRVVQAAAGRPVWEFGGRRAHGTEAARSAARAAYIGGCAGTSNVEAGRAFDLPLSGTMAHSWVMSHRSETEAFARYAALYGDRAVLLVDTYDARRAVARIAAAGLAPAAVRIDSGDLAAESRVVRAALDAAGLAATRIFASGDLDEHRVASLVGAGAPVDAFGVGTALSTSSDAPALSGVYKLVEVSSGAAVRPVVKLSDGKRTHPGRKQAWRVTAGETATHDVVGRHDETPPAGGRPLLEPVMRHGRRLRPAPDLAGLRARREHAVATLPVGATRLETPAAYRVVVSDALARLAAEVAAEVGTGDEGG